MRKFRFPYASLVVLLCGLFYCASAPHTTPAGIVAYEQQTQATIESVKSSNLPERDKTSLVRTMQAGVAIAKEQSAELQRHEARERALEDLLIKQGEELAEAKGKSGILDGLIAAAYILAGLLVVGLGFLIWRYIRNRAVKAILS